MEVAKGLLLGNVNVTRLQLLQLSLGLGILNLIHYFSLLRPLGGILDQCCLVFDLGLLRSQELCDHHNHVLERKICGAQLPAYIWNLTAKTLLKVLLPCLALRLLAAVSWQRGQVLLGISP